MRAIFPGMETPDQAWAKMTAGVEADEKIHIKHFSSNVIVMRDAHQRFPPLILVKGYERCTRAVHDADPFNF